jgi:hypothetical protein
MKTRLFAVLILLALMYQVSCKLPKSTLPPPKESSSLPGGMAGGSGNPKSNEGKKEPGAEAGVHKPQLLRPKQDQLPRKPRPKEQ